MLETVLGHRTERPPIWIMRQAGRYLPEYRKVRAGVGDFLELCYSPRLAAEVTLQPLARFDLDAAIVFSDILVVPDALGQEVRFVAGEGPRLEPLGATTIAALRPEDAMKHLAPVLETLERVRSALPAEKTLIGFCGSPSTVATYMLGGRGSPDQAAARLFEAVRRRLVRGDVSGTGFVLRPWALALVRHRLGGVTETGIWAAREASAPVTMEYDAAPRSAGRRGK